MQGAEDRDQKRSESIKSSGKTIQDAVTQGLQQLNLSEEQVEIKIIKEGSRGILGFGAEEAVVQLTPKAPIGSEAEIEPAAINASTEVAKVSNSDIASGEDLIEVAETEPDDLSISPEEPRTKSLPVIPGVDELTQKRAKEILETLLEKMSVRSEVIIRSGHDLVEVDEAIPLTLDITGHDLGVLIGRRGETLRSLQFVVRQILSKEVGHWVPVVVDVESYLVRRRKSLKRLAKRMADRVAFSKRKLTLEPMPAQERRIIHLQLRDHEDVYTQSIGDGEKRKVVIYPR